MPLFETVFTTAPHRDRCEDRVRVYDYEDRTVIVVADGAGEIGSGEFAAESVACEVKELLARCNSAESWEESLRHLDLKISSGESTCVVVDLRADRICGASVGDSQAWIIAEGEILELTRHQNRKPLLGSQSAEPVGFDAGPLRGLLVVATDGFCNYVKRNMLLHAIAEWEFVTSARKCVELVRLPTGELWDDVGIVVCRRKPVMRSRKRYEI